MKYVVATVMDQTWGYWDGLGFTTKHPEALLFNDIEEADGCVTYLTVHLPTHNFYGEVYTAEQLKRWILWIEEVPDEDEFRSQKDTW